MNSKIIFYVLVIALVLVMGWAGYRLFYAHDSEEIAKKVTTVIGGNKPRHESSALTDSGRKSADVWSDDRLKSAIGSGNSIDLKGQAEVENNLKVLSDLYNRGEDDQLLAMLNKLMAENPSVKEYPAFLGDYYYNEGNWVEAEKAIQKLVELSPENEFAKTTLGEVYAIQGRYEEGQRLQEAVLEKNPHNSDALNGLLASTEMKGKPEEGAAKIAAIAQADPANGNAWAAHAGVLLRDGKVKEAKEAIQKAMAGDPDNFLPYQTAGDMAAHEGNMPEAAKYYRDALSKQKYNEGKLIIMENLADTLYRQGDREGTKNIFKEMLAINPNNETATQGLQRLEEKEAPKKVPG